MKVVYLRPNNDVATNAIVRSINRATGELLFMEIMGMSGCVKDGLKIKGKQTYKRLLVQRVYPSIAM